MQRSGRGVLIWLISMCWVAMKHLPQTQAQLFVLATTLQPCNPPWPQSIIRIAHTRARSGHTHIHTHAASGPLFPRPLVMCQMSRRGTVWARVPGGPELHLHDFKSGNTHTQRESHTAYICLHTFILHIVRHKGDTDLNTYKQTHTVHKHVTPAAHPSSIVLFRYDVSWPAAPFSSDWQSRGVSVVCHWES